MKKNSLKLIIGLTGLILLVILIVQLIKIPTFMLPSVYLTGMFVIALLVGSLIIAGIIKLIFKKSSFVIILCFIVSIVSIFSIYKLFSPTLTIIVPKGYTGQVSLVLSNVDKDILKVDSNGIGYITKRTFDKVYTKPIVLETDGMDISNQTVGFNPSTFWSKGRFSSAIPEGSNVAIDEINFICFEVVPKDKERQKQYYNINLLELANKTKLYKNK